jgi:predicted site-specific integrase-resolvase
MISPSEQLLTKDEVAERLRIGPRTVDAWRLQGRLQGVYLTPKVIRYRASEVERMIAMGEGLDGA